MMHTFITAVILLIAAARPTVQVTHSDAVVCDGKATVKVALAIRVINPSTEPMVLGTIDVLQDRFYRREGKTLRLIRTSGVPSFIEETDEFGLPEIRDTVLPPYGEKVINTDHYIHVTADDIQTADDKARLVVSFHITNLERSGRSWEYWSTPADIILPSQCKLEWLPRPGTQR